MKKMMIAILFLVPVVLIFLVQITTEYVERNEFVAVDRIAFENTYVEIDKDSEAFVELEYPAKVYPVSATNKKINYSSENSNIATVDENGKITFKDFGEVKIIATSDASENIIATCTFFVTDDKPHYLNIDNEISSLVVGEEYSLKCSIVPNEALNKTLIYSSSNEEVAAVTSGGRIIALTGGKTTITVETYNGIKDSFELEVLIPLSSISINVKDDNLITGENKAKFPEIIFTPSDAYNKKVIYTSANKDIATIDDEGNITFSNAGKVVFYATAEDGGSKTSYTVTYTGGYVVNAYILDEYKNITEEYSLNKKVDFGVSVFPENANLQNLLLESNNPNVISVKNNELFIVGGGYATITLKASTGSSLIVDSAEIFVSRDIESIKAEDITINKPTHLLEYTLSPSDNTEEVSFSLNSDLATIDQNGYIEFKQQGVVEVTISSKNVTKKVVISYVPNSPKMLMINEDNQIIKVNYGERFGLVPDLSLGLGNTSYTVSNKKILSLFGVIFTAIDGGRTTITATSGDKTVNVIVDVIRYADYVVLESEQIDIESKKEIVTGLSSLKLDAEVVPSSTTDKTLKFYSSDEEIATIDNNGNVKYLKAGTVTFYCETVNGKKDEVIITSTNGYINEVKFDKKDYVVNFEEQREINLSYSIYPSGADSNNLSFESKNEEIATVDQNGNISILKGGNVQIVALAQNADGSIIEYVIKVKINRKATSISAENIVSSSNEVEIVYELNPSDNTDSGIISVNSSIAKLVDNKLIFSQPGIVNVIITNSDKTVSKEISVSYIPDDYKIVKIEEDNQKIEVNYLEQFAFIYDLSLGIDNPFYSKYDVSSLTLSNNVFTPIKGGESTVTVNFNDVSLNIIVNVIREVEKVSFTQNQIYTNDDTVMISANVYPMDATNKKITYTSNDLSIATVDENGLVTFLKRGTVIITAKSSNFIEANISVESTFGYATKITADDISAEYEENKEITVNYLIDPTSYKAERVNVIFVSDNENIIKVIENKLYIVGGGKTTVKVFANYDEKTTIFTTINVYVSRKTESISILNENIDEYKNISINTSEIEIIYQINPTDSTEEIIFTVDNPSIASISSSGHLSFFGYGKVTVTIESGEIIESVSVTFVSGDAEGILITESNQTVKVNNLSKFSFILDIPNKPFGVVAFSGYDETKLEYDSATQVFTAKAGGNIAITVTDSINTETINLTIIEMATDIINIEIDDLDITSKEIVTGKKELQVKAEVYRETATNKTITYSSSDEEVATVDANGLIKFNKSGSIVLTLQVDNINKKFNITSTYGKFTSFEIINEEIKVDYDNDNLEFKLSYTYLPTDISISDLLNNLSFESSKDSTVTVDSSGNIKVLCGGKATVKAYAKHVDEYIIEDEVLIDISRAATSVEIDNTNDGCTTSATYQVKANIYPNDSTDDIIYTLDSDLATVDENGLITFKKPGYVNVKVTSLISNVTDTMKVSYIPNDNYKEVSLNDLNVEVEYDKEFYLLLNEDLGLGDYYISLTNPALRFMSLPYLSLDENDGFTLKALRGGNTVIYVYGMIENQIDTDKIYAITVTIIRKAELIDVVSVTDDFVIGEITGLKQVQIQATIGPDDITDKRVVFSSSNEEIATVSYDENGIATITFLKKGTVAIGINSFDGNTSNTITIESTFGYINDIDLFIGEEQIEEDSVYEYTYSIDGNNEIVLEVVMDPKTAEKTNLSFESSNLNVASIDSNGVITVVGGGIAYITVYANDGINSNSYSFELNVDRYITEIKAHDIEISTPSQIVSYDELLPLDNTEGTVLYKVDSTIATINEKTGHLEFSKPGQVKVTIYSKLASKDILVTYIPNESYNIISLENQVVELEYNEYLYVIFAEALNLSEYTLTSTSDKVEINDNQVKAIDGGKATITATSVYDESIKIDIIVNITRYPSKVTINSEDIEIDNNSSLTSKKSFSLICVLGVGTVTVDDVWFKVDDENVATVIDNTITFVKAGKVTITAFAKSLNDTVVSSSIVVESTYGKLKSFTLDSLTSSSIIQLNNKNAKEYTINIGSYSPVDYDIDAADKVYSSSNENVVTVSNGVIKVTGNSYGESLISVTIDGITTSFNCNTTIYSNDINFTYNGNVVDSNLLWKVIGNTVQLGYVLSPTMVSNANASFSIISGDATITSSGLLTFNSKDEVVIALSSADGYSYKEIILSNAEDITVNNVSFLDESDSKYYEGKYILVERNDLITAKNFTIKAVINDNVINPEKFDYDIFTLNSNNASVTITTSSTVAGFEASVVHSSTITSLEEAVLTIGFVDGVNFAFTENAVNYTTIVYRAISELELDLDNSNDAEYGDQTNGLNLEKIRVFGTLSANGYYTYNMGVSRNPSGNTDKLSWSVSGELDTATVDENGNITFNGSAFTGYKLVTLSVHADELEKYGFVNSRIITDSYTFTVVYGYNIFNETEFGAYNGHSVVLHESITFTSNYFTTYGIGISSKVYGNGFMLDFQNVIINGEKYEVHFYNNLQNVVIRGENPNYSNGAYDRSGYNTILCFVPPIDGSTVATYKYTVFEHYGKGWTGGNNSHPRFIVFENCYLRYVKEVGIQVSKDGVGANATFYNTIWLDVGRTAIDFQYSSSSSKITIKGFFDVHNFVAASQFSDVEIKVGSWSLADVVGTVESLYESKPAYAKDFVNGTTDGANMKANIAITMISNGLSNASTSGIYFENSSGDTVDASGGAAINTGSNYVYDRLEFTVKVTFVSRKNYAYISPVANLTPSHQPNISSLYRI